jgi:PTS system mannose-specific IIB component
VISLVRVDNRLLHGQVLEAWVPHLKVQEIVVADDAASHSSLAMAATLLVLPPDLPALIRPIEEVDFAALAAEKRRILVLVREIADLEKAVAAGLTPALSPHLNLGNVHYSQGRIQVTPTIFLSKPEFAGLQRLARAGFTVEAQVIPSDTPVGLAEIEHRYSAAR